MSIVGGFLVMRQVPYVNQKREVKLGSIISPLTLAGDVTQPPDNHQVYFDGDFPCDTQGRPMQEKLGHSNGNFTLGAGLSAKHHFSSKPADTGCYSDYYAKMTTYAALVSGPAAVLDKESTARVYKSPEPEEESIFNYSENASGRVGIGALTERLKPERVAIIGLGGTGSYILDLVAKTPVREIRLIDADDFLQHNAFRAPGAASIEELREVPKKVAYYQSVYSRMHRGITAHPCAITAETLHLLDGVTFAFLSIDAGHAKRFTIEKLEVIGASFVDVGMGLELVDESLGGILRMTASTPAKREHVHAGRISMEEPTEEDIYRSNIQVADLNAMNAVMAVVKWKKLRGFYRDLEQEHHVTYTTDGNLLLSMETP
jgi:hypothetical protein